MHVVWFVYFSQKIACFSIDIEGYFWHYIGITECDMYLTILLILLILWCHINFSHFEWTHNFMSWSNPFLYIYMLYIFPIYKYVRMTILIINPFSEKRKEFNFSWYLARTSWDINKSTHGVYLLIVSTLVFHTQLFNLWIYSSLSKAFMVWYNYIV